MNDDRPSRPIPEIEAVALCAHLDQQRAHIRDWIKREQPWRRDPAPSEELPDDPFV